MATRPGFAWQNPIGTGATAQPPTQAPPIPQFGTRPGQGGLDYRNNQPNEPSLSAINDLIAELTGRQAGFGISIQPQREQAIYDLLNALNPANQTAQARSQFGALLGSSQDAGRAQAQQLTRAGYGSGAALGANLGARNQAVRQGNQNFLSMTSPQARAQNLAQILQTLNSASQPQSLSSYLSLYNSEAQKNAREEKPGFLGSILGIGGQLAGLGAFDGLFGGGGSRSGGGVPTLPQVF